MRFLPSSQEAELVNFIYLGGLEWGLGHLCVGRAVERKRKGSFLQRLQGSDWVLQLSRALHLAVLCGQLLPPSLRVRGRGDKAGAASSPDVARAEEGAGMLRDPLYLLCLMGVDRGGPGCSLVLRMALAGKCLGAPPRLRGWLVVSD